MNGYNNNWGQYNGSPTGGSSMLRQMLIQMIKASFKNGSIITQLTYINVGLFIGIAILGLVLRLFGIDQGEYDYTVSHWLGMPSNIAYFLTRPWTIFTYMFIHKDFFHLLFNMMWLNMFGKILLENFSNKQVFNLYILGGIVGAFIYLILYDVFFVTYGESIPMIGASASIMSIVFAACVFQPNREIMLMLLGSVKLIFIALGVLVFDLIGLSGTNAGGSIAHLAGAILGIIFILAINKGIDLSFSNFSTIFVKNKPKMKIKKDFYRNTNSENNFPPSHRDDERVNELLDKVSKNGYESLTKEEKAFLFKH